MSIVEVTDAGGKIVKYIQLEDGRMLPRFRVENLKNVPNIKLRKDDVLICAYTKSGTHWLSEILKMLTQGKVDVPVVSKMQCMLEFQDEEKLDATPSPRILNTHYKLDYLPNVYKEKLKIVYVRRNPKDVAVSLFNHTVKLKECYSSYNGKFSDFLRLFVEGRVDYGSWFEYVKEWEKIIQKGELNILPLTYEDIKEDPLREIRKISDFLELERNEDLLEKIKEHTSFSSMLKRKGGLKTQENGQPIMYRKGEVGDWKNWFTVADNEWFDSIYQQNMKDSDLEFRYEL